MAWEAIVDILALVRRLNDSLATTSQLTALQTPLKEFLSPFNAKET